MLTFFKSAGVRVSASTAAEPAKVEQADEAALAVPVPDTSESAAAEVASVHSANSSSSLSSSSHTDAYGAPSGHATPQAASGSLTPVHPKSAPLPQSSVQSLLVPPSPGQGTTAESTSNSTPEVLGASPYPNAKTGKDPVRFSFRSFSFLRSESKLTQPERKPSHHSEPIHTQPPVLSKVHEKEKKSRASKAFTVRALQSKTSDKRARDTAALVRSVIVGDHEIALDSRVKKSKPLTKSDLARVKAQLLDPKSASKVIGHLHAMSASLSDSGTANTGPIRAVCLDSTDKEAHEQYFVQFGSVATASVTALSEALADVHLVDLLAAPDMGFGAPASSPGLLAGAVPSAETIIDGLQQITPQLLALGYATSKAILPDHKGVIVPTDRLSVLTYWWGFEVCMPPPTLEHIAAAASPGTALLNLLTALSLVSPGVREVLPFIRYVAQFVQTEWRMIKAADKGKGVVCCATWIMPAAMIARPWDFPDPPPATIVVGPGANLAPTASRPATVVATPKPSVDAPRASSAYSSETGEEGARHVISSDPPVLPELVVSSPASHEGKPSIDLEIHKPSADVPRDADPFSL
ncbi:uncharacterized protein EDB91DRAFT_1348393 [Suillus paluster]|uniref:uncharacterized protein n=1 Tax=Suillus paluster TaxID=48578 RepID=UPI001B8706C1|nr:uncharacterized protein EDB91DRAFT_1348393 [Suillus paluster]KAG1735119.1 hypothetical protein EDB91DRAFT_1348393 [Suillus paluster]